jgi:hypothetical protein
MTDVIRVTSLAGAIANADYSAERPKSSRNAAQPAPGPERSGRGCVWTTC